MQNIVTRWIVRLLIKRLLSPEQRAVFFQAWDYGHKRFHHITTRQRFIHLAIEQHTSPPHREPVIYLAFACQHFLHDQEHGPAPVIKP